MQIKSIEQLHVHVYDQVNAQLNPNKSNTLLVGLSGGMDSCVLLHLLSSVIHQFDRLLLSAIHVNHGINKNSNSWAEFCQQFCDVLNVPLQISRHRLDQVKANREAVFRDVRYQAFKDNLPESGLLLTAHHQHDQIETVLFNLFRGAGVSGLRGMKPCRRFESGYHLRPLLTISPALLMAYARHYNLKWIEDPSNQDVDIDRNYIRQRIIPQIVRRWPGAPDSISRSAGLLTQSEQLHDEIAKSDFDYCSVSDYPGVIINAYLSVLDLSRIQQLSVARQFNMLKFWLINCAGISLSTGQLNQLQGDLCSNAKHGLFESGGFQIRVFGGFLYLMKSLPESGGLLSIPLILNDRFIFKDLNLSIQMAGNSSVDLEFIKRQGGEKIRRHGQSQRLKTIYQQNSIPTWERNLIPLIIHNNRLVAVPGVVSADDCPFGDATVSKITLHLA